MKNAPTVYGISDSQRSRPKSAAIAATGAAKVLASTASASQIARAVEEILGEPSYAEAARRVGEMIPAPGEQHPATTLLAEMIDDLTSD